MKSKPVNLRGDIWRVASYLVGCILLCQSTFGQEVNAQSHKSVYGEEKLDKTLVRGCLNHVLDQFHFASDDLDTWVVLTGNTEGLENYVNRELLLEGTKGEAIRIEGYFDPVPSFVVSRIVRVFEEAEPELAPDFAEKSAWRTVVNKKYGVRFAIPVSMVSTESNLDGQEGFETVTSFEIPGTTYPNANLRGGSFAILVNRYAKTRKSCTQFAETSASDERPSFYTVGNLRYLKTANADVGMGSWELWNSFHIFRNGLCYKVAFELKEYNARDYITGCNIPLLSAEDNWDLIKSLLDSVSFFPPVVHSSAKHVVGR